MSSQRIFYPSYLRAFFLDYYFNQENKVLQSFVFELTKNCMCSSVSMAEGSVSLEEVKTSFQKFAVHGDTKATGKEMNGKNFAKLCKDCNITDGKNVTTTDVDIVFSKVK